MPVIREDLTRAVQEALAKAGLPEPADGVVVQPSNRREHGDWTTSVVLQVASAAGLGGAAA